MGSRKDHVFHRALKPKWITVAKGEGVYLYDDAGQKYLDACSGVYVANIGHAVPEIIQAIQEQATKVSYVHGNFMNEPKAELAQFLAELCPDSNRRVFFVSSGSEGTESAIKIARKYHIENGNPQRYKVVSRWQAWHGNTIGALSLSGRTSFRQDYTPYLCDFPHISPPYCTKCPVGQPCAHVDPDELERVILQEGPGTVSAFIAEPILGSSASAYVPSPDYYPRLKRICEKYGVLFIADEVVTGLGRTGLPFGINHWNVDPDIIVVGKGLGCGYTPIAANIVKSEIYDVIYRNQTVFVHGHTFTGNPQSCATALAVQRYIEAHNLISRAGEMGEILLMELKKRFQGHPHVSDVRGKGLLIGMEFAKEKRVPFDPKLNLTQAIVAESIRKGVIILAGAPGIIDGVAGDHIAISPPFTLTHAHIQQIVEVVGEAVDFGLEKVLAQKSAA